MGYATSHEAINRVKGFLETLKNTKENVVAWKSNDPKKLQYQLHCGLAAAKRLDDIRFNDLKDIWKIKIKQDLVIVERKVELIPPTAALIFESVGDIYAIITKATAYTDVNQELIFTQVSLDDESKEKLDRWAQAKGYIYKMDETTLTLSRI